MLKMRNATSMIQFDTDDNDLRHKIKHIDISITNRKALNYFKNFQKLENVNLGKSNLSALSELGNVKNLLPNSGGHN